MLLTVLAPLTGASGCLSFGPALEQNCGADNIILSSPRISVPSERDLLVEGSNFTLPPDVGSGDVAIISSYNAAEGRVSAIAVHNQSPSTQIVALSL